MNLKHPIFVSSLLFLCFSPVALAQQATKADIQVLDAKMNALQTTVTEMDKRLTNQIVEMDKRLTNQIMELDKRLTARIDILFWAIGALIALVLAVIALPQVFGYLQGRKERADLQKQIDELSQRIEQQQREIEALKSRRIMTPS